MNNNTIICFDLKSFFASVECVERNLDPMKVNLLVADNSRTDKTICLAVTPPLKSLGVPGRPRLFEAKKCIQDLNRKRYINNNYKKGTKSIYIDNINKDQTLEIDYIIAPPRMAYYIEYSTKIYNIYLRYFAPEDIHVYSIDEVFIDATNYMKLYNVTPKQLAANIINTIYKETKITTTSGIGTNLYLAKIAMDIMAKKLKLEINEPRIAYLDEKEYKKQLWDHKPLTDFWRIGNGISNKLNNNHIYTMGDIARCSLNTNTNNHHNEALLYKLFGINAELLIDHAWGIETTTIKDIKSYKPICNSFSSGQVLHKPYTKDNARIVLREMIDSLVLDLVEKKLVTNLITLSILYDNSNLTDPIISEKYEGDIVRDGYNILMPKPASGSIRINMESSSEYLLSNSTIALYDNITNPLLLIRKLNISVNNLKTQPITFTQTPNQLNLFDQDDPIYFDFNKENKLSNAMVNIKNKYGKNALLKLSSLNKEATAKERNKQIGGHKA